MGKSLKQLSIVFYLHSATEVVYKDIDKAIFMADSLALHSENNLQGIKPHLLLSMIYNGKASFRMLWHLH